LGNVQGNHLRELGDRDKGKDKGGGYIGTKPDLSTPFPFYPLPLPPFQKMKPNR
jgi:hypothetical protein